MNDEKQEENAPHAQVEESAEEDLDLNDEDAGKVVGGIVPRKAGEQPLEY